MFVPRNIVILQTYTLRYASTPTCINETSSRQAISIIAHVGGHRANCCILKAAHTIGNGDFSSTAGVSCVVYGTEITW